MSDQPSFAERQKNLPVPQGKDNPKFWDVLFYRIGEGDSLRQIAKEFGVPKSTLWDWIRNDRDLTLRYGEAQQSRAIYHAQRVEELIEKVERGEMNPQSARVSIDARKWLAAKMYPKKISDRYQIKHDVSVDDRKQHIRGIKADDQA